VTVYGKQFTGVTKWSFTYDQPTTAPAGATVKIKNSNDKVYYVSDYNYSGDSASSNIPVSIPAFAFALNCIADKNAEVTLLENITTAPTEVLNRGFTLTIDGNGKAITFATNGLTVTSGNITVKNLTINASTAAPPKGNAGAYALRIAKTAAGSEDAKDSYTLNVSVIGCTFNAYAPIQDNAFLSGSVSFTNTTSNGIAVNINHVYTAPEPTPPEIMEDEDEDESDETTDPGAENTPDAPATDAPATNGGCKGAIGIGAIAVMAAAGLACGIASKKRED
jgi:hypothetical protein